MSSFGFLWGGAVVGKNTSVDDKSARFADFEGAAPYERSYDKESGIIKYNLLHNFS